MKTKSTVLTYSLLALFAWSLTGCGEKEDERNADSTTVTSEAAAQTNAEIKNGMIELSKDMTGIVEGINSVEDAENAKPEIEGAMGDFLNMLSEVGTVIDKMSTAEIEEFKNGQAQLLQDEELAKWRNKMQVALAEKRTQHPEAAAKLDSVTEEVGRKFVVAMRTIVQKIDQKSGTMQGMPAPESHSPADTGAGRQ